jgi:hypothetical protein
MMHAKVTFTNGLTGAAQHKGSRPADLTLLSLSSENVMLTVP